MSRNRLAASVNASVMQDEARHVAFGRLALRELFPQLSEAERDEREEFVVEGGQRGPLAPPRPPRRQRPSRNE